MRQTIALSCILAMGAMSMAASELPTRTGSAVAVLSESFEVVNARGVPDGWSLKSVVPEGSMPNMLFQWWNGGWKEVGGVPAADGERYMIVEPGTEGKYFDEWLISPYFNVKTGYDLSFYAFISPLNFFVLDQDHVNFQTFEWKKKEQYSTLQVLVNEEGAEDWEVVKDFYDDYIDTSFRDCLHVPQEMIFQYIDLDKYEGKNLRVGFRHVGRGHSQAFYLAIDDVVVDRERMKVSYNEPKGTLYYGSIFSPEITVLDEVISLLPVYTPLTWENTSPKGEGYSFEWEYTDPTTNRKMISTDDNLTLTFTPNYTSEATTLNNLLNNVKLSGYRDGLFGASFSGLTDWLQAGGRPKMNISGEELVFGLLPFDTKTAMKSVTMSGSMEYGEEWIPILGYYYVNGNERSAQYNTLRYFGDDFVGTDWVAIRGIGNVIDSPESPLVITKVWANARGYIGKNCDIKLTIYGLDKDMNKVRPVGRGKMNYDEMQESYNTDDDWNYLAMPFDLNSAVVLDNSFPYYYVEISGFDDPSSVQYFAAMETKFDAPTVHCPGHVTREVFHNGELTTELVPISEYADVAETDKEKRAFYINMDGYYPWLHADVYSLNTPRGEQSVLPLDSYYDGADIHVEVIGLPAGHALPLATVNGKNNKAELQVEMPDCDCEGYHTLQAVLSAPGVYRVITLSDDPASVGAIEACNGEVECIYSVEGYRVDARNLTPGSVYIVRYKDGKTSRVVAK